MIVGAEENVPKRKHRREVFIHMLWQIRVMDPVTLRTGENPVEPAEPDRGIEMDEVAQQPLK
jgi:hypothetical protein